MPPFLQVNGVDVNNINSLSDLEHVLEYVESAIDDSGTEKSPSVVLETFRECAKLVFRIRNDANERTFFRDYCFVCRILGQALKSEAGNHAAVRGRLVGLAEGLGVAVGESSVTDAEFRSEGIRKFCQNSSGKAKSYVVSLLPPNLG